MSITPTTRVADLVLEQPGRAGVLESLGIDYCCGGRVPLETACAERGLDVAAVVSALAAAPAPVDPDLDVAHLETGDLIAHIVDRHHGYVRAELPELAPLLDKVVRVHGDLHPELAEVAAVFHEVASELSRHLVDEEATIFPACSDAMGDAASELAGEIARMEDDHVLVGTGLARMRELTGLRSPRGRLHLVPGDAPAPRRARARRAPARPQGEQHPLPACPRRPELSHKPCRSASRSCSRRSREPRPCSTRGAAPAG